MSTKHSPTREFLTQPDAAPTLRFRERRLTGGQDGNRARNAGTQAIEPRVDSHSCEHLQQRRPRKAIPRSRRGGGDQPHGSLDPRSVSPSLGSRIEVLNSMSQETREFRVIRVSDPKADGQFELGVEILYPGKNFWGIQFPDEMLPA